MNFMALRRRVLLILGLSLVAAAIAALITFFIPPARAPHVATAQLMIQGRLPVEDLRGIPDQQDESTVLTPVTYRMLLLSDSLLARVAQKLGAEASAGDLRSAVDVEVALESDTAYRRVYSPLITLRVRQNSPAQSFKVLDMWLREFFEAYGSLRGGTLSGPFSGTEIKMISEPIVVRDEQPRKSVMRSAALAALLTLVVLGTAALVEWNVKRR